MQDFNHYFEDQANLLIKKANNLRNRSSRQFAYKAAILTIYGFQVAIPVTLGIFFGSLLDKRHPVEHISWTLNAVLLGGIIGFYNANMWFYKTIGLKKKKGDKK